MSIKSLARLTLVIFVLQQLNGLPGYSAEVPNKLERVVVTGGGEVFPNKDIPIKGGAEYFSANPNYKVLIPINIWGEVNSPGVHYLPVGASLSLGISLAGGPKQDASLPDVTLTRNQESRRIDLFEVGPRTLLQQNDTITVKTSIRRDLPIVLSVISTVLSLVTLTVLLRK
jgi:hypothetical protein